MGQKSSNLDAPKNFKKITHKTSNSTRTQMWIFILENKFDTFVNVIGRGKTADDAKTSILEKFTEMGQENCEKFRQQLFDEGTISMWFDNKKMILPTSSKIISEREMAFFL
jgi:hypothetical protein